ncbi:diaminopropionate ammonia-lyase [Streptomyces sp. Edi4]|uniref:diaminopropionate ammonia-lyase n=1 Tax=Streptomyces sp. Edi4 TaxID=3162527 RepID=UPI003305D089
MPRDAAHLATGPLPLFWSTRRGGRAWRCEPAPSGARDFHAGLPDYEPTPLVELPSLAMELGLGRVFVKDESCRLGLPSFKALGASWAIRRVLDERTACGEGAGRVTLVTATDGNHGRAVARMAHRLGQRAHVFVPRGVHPRAVAAIAAERAGISEVAGPYDEAVRRAAEAAAAPDAVLVQDTAWPGYERIPGWIVEGYSTLCAELDEQLAARGVGEGPDLVAVPVGVGSLAQAVVRHYRSLAPGRRSPALLSVEPQAAACVLSGLTRGARTSITTGDTTMVGLNCGTPSSIAWPYLRAGLDASVAVPDPATADAVARLASLGVSSGPCGAAALAGMRTVLGGAGAERRRTTLGLGPDSTVVLLSTEGVEANPPAP